MKKQMDTAGFSLHTSFQLVFSLCKFSVVMRLVSNTKSVDLKKKKTVY